MGGPQQELRSWTRVELRPFELLSSPVWVFDIQAETMWWANAAAVDLWDATSLDALLARDFSSEMSNTTRTRLRDALDHFEAGETLRESWAFYPKGMAAVNVSCVISGIRIDVDGPRLAMLVEARLPETGIPAHELRAVEALRHTRVVVSLFDAQGEVLFENPAALGTLGHGASPPSLWSRFTDPEDAQRVRQALEWGQVYSGEVLMRTAVGPRWYGMDVSPTRDPVAASPAILVNARDITEEREAKAGLIEATRAADAANRAKSAFLANVSHEIRTPMNGVLGMSRLLLETGLDQEQQGYAEAVHVSACGLLAIINDILDLSRIDAQKLTLEEIEFDLRGILEEALQVQSGTSADKGLELTSFVDRSIPKTLRGDPGRLRQILINILGNAVKFTDEGEVTVAVSRVEHAPTSVLLRFEVRDTGIGIPEEARRRVFEPFVQADGSMTRRFGGTGLGLAIAKQLVSMMGGDIGVEATEGAGSTFWFTCRMATLASREPPAPEPVFAGVEAMVVDEHESSRTMLVGLLAELGIEASHHASAAAVARLREQTVPGRRVVFIGQGADGPAVAHVLRSSEALRDTRTIFVWRMGARRLSASTEGIDVDGHLSKPVRRARLVSVLRAVLPEPPERSGRAAAEAGSMELGGGEAPPRAAARVLVADDNLINQMVICKVLERFGVKTDVVANGEDAVKAINTRLYDLVLMDCQMPVLDGYAATRRVRELAEPQCRTPVVAMTASAMAGDRERCLEAGMNDYVAKPIQLDDVQRILGNFLGES